LKTIVKYTLTKKEKKNLFRIIVATLLLIVAKLIEVEVVKLILFAIAYIIVGYDIIKKAFKGIVNKQVFDENFLMTVATIGAIILGDYSEGVMVMLVYQIGELFQSIAISKSRKNIADLMDIRPDYAYLVKDNDKYEKVDPNDVPVGSTILVKVGDKVPIDGVIIKGETTLNTAALTGESKPRTAGIKDEVISGSINMTGGIAVQTTKEFGESTASKILDLVENATSNKSKSEDFITKFAKYYTPIVCIAAVVVAIIPPLFNVIIGNPSNIDDWVFKALTFLVISCPCALVISIPLSFFAAIGGASSHGVLIKGSNYVENLSNTKYVVFDKTGTMTKGVFEVNGIHHSPLSDEQVIEYAAYSECLSNHPIAKSIVTKYDKPIDKTRIDSIKEISGMGIKAIIDKKQVVVGNEKLFEEEHIEIKVCEDDFGTVVHVAIDGEYAGHLLINDIIKENSKPTIETLNSIGITNTIMLTGDDEKVANHVKDELGISEVHANLLPQDKVNIVQDMISKKQEKDKLMFIGDGINDAPVIMLSDVGVAMGALGSDAAIEAADVVLMDDDPLKAAKAIIYAKKCMRIVYENIIFAIGIKILVLILSLFGITDMWLAVFADTGVMVLAVLNSIRALRIKV